MGRAATRNRNTALAWRIAAVLSVTAAPIALGACSSSGSSGSTTCKPSTSTEVHALDSLRFRPDCLNVRAGAVKITLVDGGSQTHTFEIHGVSGKAQVSGGQSDTVTFHLAKGKYTFYCSIPGHEAAGMKGTLIVS
jgi:plastocyanin